MTRGDLPRLAVWGRPLKPVALGLSLAMVVIAATNLSGYDRGVTPPLTWFLAAAGTTAAVCLVAGWVCRSQRFAEVGLLLVVLTYTTRAAFVYLSTGFDQAVAFSVTSSIIAGGAYLLEAADHEGGRWWTPFSRHYSPR
jgi:hypothetical protein